MTFLSTRQIVRIFYAVSELLLYVLHILKHMIHSIKDLLILLGMYVVDTKYHVFAVCKNVYIASKWI